MSESSQVDLKFSGAMILEKILERFCPDLIIHTLRVQIPIWDVETGPSNETV
jgi:hypothetical protein